MSCQFGGVVSFYCVSNACQNNKQICSSRVCSCAQPHSKCKLLKKDIIIDCLLKKFNPQFDKIANTYDKTIQRLTKQRIKRLADISTVQKSYLSHQQLQILEKIKKSQQISDIQNLISRYALQNVLCNSKTTLLSSPAHKSTSQCHTNKCDCKLTEFINNINQSIKNFVQTKSINQKLLEQYFLIRLQQNGIKKVTIQGIDYQTLPNNVDYSKITYLQMKSLNMTVSRLIVRYITNLKLISVSQFVQDAQYHQPYIMPSRSPVGVGSSSLCFKIIKQLSKIPSLQQVQISNAANSMNSQQFMKFSTMFPKSKCLKVNSTLSYYCIMEILIVKPLWQTIILHFDPRMIFQFQNLLQFIHKTSPKLKNLAITNIEFNQNVIDRLGKFNNLENLEFNLNEDKLAQLKGSSYHTIMNINSQQHFSIGCKHLFSSLNQLKKLNLSNINTSHTQLQSIHLSCSNLVELQVQSNGTIQTITFFRCLGKFKQLKKLILIVGVIKAEEWRMLSQADFKLDSFWLLQNPNRNTYYYNENNELQRMEDQSADSKKAQKYMLNQSHSFIVDQISLFFANQPQIKQFRTKSIADDELCRSLRYLKQLEVLSFHYLFQTPTPLSNSGFIYLSKHRFLREYTVFNPYYNDTYYNIQTSYFRLVANNRQIQLKQQQFVYSNKKLLRNISIFDKVKHFMNQISYRNVGYTTYGSGYGHVAPIRQVFI